MPSYKKESFACSSLVRPQCIGSKHMEQAKKTLVRDNKSKQNKLSEKEEEKEENSTWTHVPDDILEQIMKRLCLADYLGLRAICSPWRATVDNAIAKKRCHPLPELPRIVLQSEDISFFRLGTESEHHSRTPLLEYLCHGSVEGWLIVSDYFELASLALTVFFFNPATNRRVLVPSQLYFPCNSPIQADRLSVSKMVASSTPDCYESDCFLAGLFNDYCHIAIYRLFDKSWTMIETDKDSGIYFLDVEIIGMKLYVRTDTSLDSILVYNLKASAKGPPKPKVLAMLPQIRPTPASRMLGKQRSDLGHPIYFLAKDEALGELYLIHMFCNSRYETKHVGYLNIVTEFVKPPQITRVEVFKLDMSKEHIQWKKESLDDRVVFVSSYKSMEMSRTALNTTQELIRGNCIYFALSYPCPINPWSAFHLGVICLADNSIEYFPVETSNYCKVPYPFWFVPSV